MMRDINELKQRMNAISTKIVGTGIGNVSEKTVIKDLKGAMSNTLDSFSDERALKQGTEIVGTCKGPRKRLWKNLDRRQEHRKMGE